MTNNLTEDKSKSYLLFLNYENILKTILTELNKSTNLFTLSNDRRRLTINIDTLAQAIATINPTSPILGQEWLARTATLNFHPEFKDEFPKAITKIKETLANLLQTCLTTNNFNLTELVTSLSQYKASQPQLNLLYPFPPLSNITQQSLTINPEATGSASALKLHKVIITVKNLTQFTDNLKQGLENYLENELGEDEDYVENLRDILKEGKDIDDLKKFINQETIGQLKREAYLKYLEYLDSNIDEYKYRDVYYLKDLIRRLKLLKDFFNPTEIREDNYYQITYDGITIDLKTVVAQSYAFDCLPIIPIIAGNLGEISGGNQDNPQFVFGLKMKLNKSVQTAKGQSVFAYNLDLLNPKSQNFKEQCQKAKEKEKFYQKTFQRFCVYFFVLTSRCQPNDSNYDQADELTYNPVESFHKCLEILKGDNQQQKENLLFNFTNGLNKPEFRINQKLAKLATLLENILKCETRWRTQEYPVHLEIQRGILNPNPENISNNRSFLKNKGQPKLNLRYVKIGEARINSSAFCQLEATLTIEDIRYQLGEEKLSFNMEYDLGGIQTLPIVFSPRNKDIRDVYTENFQKKNNKLINFPYSVEVQNFNSPQQFNYYFTFTLLTYICLKIITDEINSKLFLPILRLHFEENNLNNVDEEEIFNIQSDMRGYSKVLAHLLSMDHLSNSQGIDISAKNEQKKFKISNSWNSLYSVIPKNFSFPSGEYTPNLDKLALIVVSSQEADGEKKTSRSLRISNLIGEVITMNLLASGQIQIKTCQSLSANYINEKMYCEPTIILDTVTNLYNQGYRHIFYIAKTPHTSNLHLTQEDSNNLFFLSRDLIKYIYQDYQDLSLYPVFFEQYYVRKLSNKLTQSLSLQDSRQLQDLFNDPNQKAVIFFNLFNGITVKEQGSFYNGVISYSTLVGVYQDLFDDQAIRQNLLYNQGKKNDLLQYLTLFHFSRYEKSSKNSSLKLNPYQNIVSEESTSKLSLFKHPQNKADFNLLAFLTEVRRILTLTPQSNHESN